MSTHVKASVVGSKTPTQWESFGAKMTSPFASVLAPINLASMLMVDEMSTHVKALLLGSKTPTQSALCGAKMMRPSADVVAPSNLRLMLMVDEMSTHVKALLVGLKTPTQTELRGVKMTSPLAAVVAPQNLSYELVEVEEMSTHVKALLVGLKTPTQLMLIGGKMTSPLAAVAALSNFQWMLLMVEVMSTHVKALVVGLKTPMQSAKAGAKMTSPLAAVVALRNFLSLLMVDEMSTHEKALLVGLKTPTQSALVGAKMTSPLAAVVAPANFSSLLMVDEMSTHVKSLASCRRRPQRMGLLPPATELLRAMMGGAASGGPCSRAWQRVTRAIARKKRRTAARDRTDGSTDGRLIIGHLGTPRRGLGPRQLGMCVRAQYMRMSMSHVLAYSIHVHAHVACAQSGRMRPTRPDPLEPPGGRMCGAVTSKQGGQRFQPELEYRCHWRRTERPSNDSSAAPTSPPRTETVMNGNPMEQIASSQMGTTALHEQVWGVNSGHRGKYARARAFHASCEVTMLGEFLLTYSLTHLLVYLLMNDGAGLWLFLQLPSAAAFLSHNG